MDGLARQLPYVVETGMSVTVAKAEPDSDDVGEVWSGGCAGGAGGHLVVPLPLPGQQTAGSASRSSGSSRVDINSSIGVRISIFGPDSSSSEMESAPQVCFLWICL